MPPPDVSLQLLRGTLRDEQREHLETVNWILDGPRASGRTLVLAIGFIEHAMRSNGMWIRPFDHYIDSPSGVVHLMETIRGLTIQHFGNNVFEFSVDGFGGRFRYAGPLVQFPDVEVVSAPDATIRVERPAPPATTSGHRTMDLDE